MAERVEGTPAEQLCRELPADEAADTPPLSKRQWGNLALVFLFSQGLQVALVSAMVFVFLFVFGVLVVTEPIARGFVDAQPNVLASFDLWGRDLVITEELLRVTGFLTVFAGLYFAVTAADRRVVPEGVHRRDPRGDAPVARGAGRVSRGAEPRVASRAG